MTFLFFLNLIRFFPHLYKLRQYQSSSTTNAMNPSSSISAQFIFAVRRVQPEQIVSRGEAKIINIPNTFLMDLGEAESLFIKKIFSAFPSDILQLL